MEGGGGGEGDSEGDGEEDKDLGVGGGEAGKPLTLTPPAVRLSTALRFTPVEQASHTVVAVQVSTGELGEEVTRSRTLDVVTLGTRHRRTAFVAYHDEQVRRGTLSHLLSPGREVKLIVERKALHLHAPMTTPFVSSIALLESTPVRGVARVANATRGGVLRGLSTQTPASTTLLYEREQVRLAWERVREAGTDSAVFVDAVQRSLPLLTVASRSTLVIIANDVVSAAAVASAAAAAAAADAAAAAAVQAHAASITPLYAAIEDIEDAAAPAVPVTPAAAAAAAAARATAAAVAFAASADTAPRQAKRRASAPGGAIVPPAGALLANLSPFWAEAPIADVRKLLGTARTHGALAAALVEVRTQHEAALRAQAAACRATNPRHAASLLARAGSMRTGLLVRHSDMGLRTGDTATLSAVRGGARAPVAAPAAAPAAAGAAAGGGGGGAAAGLPSPLLPPPFILTPLHTEASIRREGPPKADIRDFLGSGDGGGGGAAAGAGSGGGGGSGRGGGAAGEGAAGEVAAAVEGGAAGQVRPKEPEQPLEHAAVAMLRPLLRCPRPPTRAARRTRARSAHSTRVPLPLRLPGVSSTLSCCRRARPTRATPRRSACGAPCAC